MVLTIQPLIHENERDLLIGHIAMVLGKYDIAQEYYLKSSEPLNALDMRCDIQDWFIASSLTKSIAPEQESFISKRLATQTESQGNNTEALKQFEKSVITGVVANVEKSVIERHNMECFSGIARTSIKLGDIQRGFNIAREIKDKNLLLDIAVVCENMKQIL
jgi:WD repeat-containing protein 19